MKIGVPKEIKPQENRVGLTPASVRELVHHGHCVVVETEAGHGIGMTDDAYRAVGAEIGGSAADVFEAAELIVKVKEPQAAEGALLRDGQILFTYLHLAPDPDQTQMLRDRGVTAIAYETVTDTHGHLPLLAPMSAVAGRMAIQAGAHALEKHQGGKGILLGGVPGVAPAEVVVIGGGTVGTNAVMMAMGLGAHVTVLDRSLDRLEVLDAQFGSHLNTLYSTLETVEQAVTAADLVIGGVLVPGAAAPKLVSRAHVRAMADGGAIVDVAIDQGGCVETARPTTHADPLYEDEGIIHYCVTNMPGGVPRTSAFALNIATLPYVLALADKGWAQALSDDAGFAQGLNVQGGHIVCEAVAQALGAPVTALSEVL